MDTKFEEIEYKGHVIELHYDPLASSPREYDNLGVFLTWRRGYESPDDNPFPTPEAFLEYAENDEVAIVLPVFMYKHSIVAFATKPFSCVWDSGQVGYIYMTQEELDRIGGDVEKGKTYLEKEVSLYSAWASGENYGSVIKKGDEVVNSCWGFVGDEDKDYTIEEAKRYVDFEEKRRAERREEVFPLLITTLDICRDIFQSMADRGAYPKELLTSDDRFPDGFGFISTVLEEAEDI